MILLFVEPLSSLFFVLYIVCGATDILDGSIARKTKNTSAIGAIFDSVADFIFIMIMLFIMIPIIDMFFWIQLWLISISMIKAISLLTGFIKYYSLAFLHTYMNKITGVLLFAFPLLYYWFGISIVAALLCSFASIAAVEEMVINLTSNKLSYNIKSIFLK
ncbi:CDP-diacylglycerol--glycerol-3-phosphate 3-phosphatidyltransferase [Sedimentibacter acidaminivorans]|uniref:CDP-diacylglycerol--glycerol-3-phosphate 3-phosphatidyltransferase n=1 Tax=Sedimentibacter acidaminivorans TaxID=913099 RepID=A0ABS4GB64_9FIRM|nr:CDP-diacylglycerol--glycerol-3-phosphate 3-phosphatidyltransferase [Sedimentibacter acidaminivorans]